MSDTVNTKTVILRKHVCRVQNAYSSNARQRRAILATVLTLAALTGHSDGSTYAVCVGCAQRATVGTGASNRGTLHLGHVLSDANDGTFCPCNLLPLCAACNQDMGKETLTDVLVPVYDNRMYFRAWERDPGTSWNKTEDGRGRSAWNRP